MVQQTFAANQDQILQDGSKRVGALRALGIHYPHGHHRR